MSSHNYLCSIGIKKPFKKLNERLQAQRTYADIVFAKTNENTMTTKKSDQDGFGNTIFTITKSLIIAGGVAALAAIDFNQEDLTMARTLIVVAIVFTAL